MSFHYSTLPLQTLNPKYRAEQGAHLLFLVIGQWARFRLVRRWRHRHATAVRPEGHAPVLLFLNTFLSGPVAPRTRYNKFCIYFPHQAYNTVNSTDCETLKIR